MKADRYHQHNPRNRADGTGDEHYRPQEPQGLAAYLYDQSVKYRRQLIMVVGLVALGGGGGSLYYLYRSHHAQQAHKAYMSALELYNAEVSSDNTQKRSLFERVFTSEHQKWEAVATKFSHVAEQYKSTPLGLQAGLVEAEALMKLGKKDQARARYETYVHKLPSGAIKDAYMLSYALLLIDSPNSDEHQRGESLLHTQASSRDSVVHDFALYRLAQYQLVHNQVEQARGTIDQLVSLYGGSEQPSEWAEKGKELFPGLYDKRAPDGRAFTGSVTG